jgi:hypothetical protein
VGKVGAGAGEGSAICLSICASPQRLSPAAASQWRGELPPALDALCSAAKRAPREPAALGAGRALGGRLPSQDMSGGGRQAFLGAPNSPREGIALGKPCFKSSFTHSFNCRRSS